MAPTGHCQNCGACSAGSAHGAVNVIVCGTLAASAEPSGASAGMSAPNPTGGESLPPIAAPTLPFSGVRAPPAAG